MLRTPRVKEREVIHQRKIREKQKSRIYRCSSACLLMHPTAALCAGQQQPEPLSTHALLPARPLSSQKISMIYFIFDFWTGFCPFFGPYFPLTSTVSLGWILGFWRKALVMSSVCYLENNSTILHFLSASDDDGLKK